MLSVKTCFLLYSVYLLCRVSYNLSPYTSYDLDAPDPYDPEAANRFWELSLPSKVVTCLIGVPTFVLVEFIPLKTALAVRFLAQKIRDFILELPRIIWSFIERVGRFVKNSAIFIWNNILYPFGVFVKDVVIRVSEFIKDSAILVWENILYPLSVFVVKDCIVSVAKWTYTNVIVPLVLFVADKIDALFTAIFNTIDFILTSITRFFYNILINLPHYVAWIITSIVIPFCEGLKEYMLIFIRPIWRLIVGISEFITVTLPQRLLELYNIAVNVFYYVYTPVKEWVVDKLTKLWNLICFIYDLIATAIYNTWCSFKSMCYEIWITVSTIVTNAWYSFASAVNDAWVSLKAASYASCVTTSNVVYGAFQSCRGIIYSAKDVCKSILYK